MKKLLLPLLILGLVFSSCEQEDLSSATELEGVAGKAKINQQKSEDESCSEDGKCETAFGRYCPCADLNICFIDMDYGINRWGWSVKLTSRQPQRFGLYAGVGQCDMTKGTEVGYVYVTFNANGSVTHDEPVMYSGFTLKEFHFYAGDTPVPIGKNGKHTVAPGQFYNTGDVDENDEVYVILHAVVCGDFED